MIRDFTKGKEKFVQIKVSTPDGRGGHEPIKGGFNKKSALFEAKKYPKEMIIDLFDSKD